LAWISCGYGVRPSHTILLSFAIILLFAGIFWAGSALEFESMNLQEHQTVQISLKDTLYFSSMQFLGRTPQSLAVLGAYQYITVVETLLGWLLMALFLVTLSKVMLR
jgi:hypothetical protein